MTRNAYFDSPFLLGFEPLERLLERTAKSAGDSYPPYNIEATPEGGIAITLAVAGFAKEEIAVTVEDRQLVIRGRQNEAGAKRSFTAASRRDNFCALSCLPTASKSNLPRWKMDCCG